jgi:hypothetical protein
VIHINKQNSLPYPSTRNKNIKLNNLKNLIEDNCGGMKKEINSMRNISKGSNIGNAGLVYNNKINFGKNKILSMEQMNVGAYNNNAQYNNNFTNENVKTNSTIEEEPETVKKMMNDKRNEVDNFEDDFDDINSIIKHIKFDNIDVNKDNIFSKNNFLYNLFEEKFIVEFETIMMPNFQRR